MKKPIITIAYYHCVKLPKVEWKHLQEIPYTQKTREMVVNTVLKAGYNVMLQQTGLKNSYHDIILWIDNGAFKQR